MSWRQVAAISGLIALVALAAAIVWLWTPDKDRADLEARYADVATDFIDAAGLRLHLRQSGPVDAPVLILLHGFGASLHTWEAWAQSLSDAYRVIRYDLPGAGLTGADPTGDYSDDRGMQVLLAVMDALGVKQASIVGHSMGGRLAWRFAAAHPQRVERLVLVAPDGFASPGFEYGKPPVVPSMVKLMQYFLPRALVRMSLAPAYANPSALTDAELTRYHDLIRAPGVRSALIARMEQSVLPDPLPILARIRAPTLLLWGEQDAMIPVGNSADYVAALPSSRLIRLPGVGHLPQEEAAGESVAAVRMFLRE